MARTKESDFDTDEVRKVRAEYLAVIAEREALERRLGEIADMKRVSPFLYERRCMEEERRGLLMKFEVVKATQGELKEALNREAQNAFGTQVRLATDRVEALECLYRVLMRYIQYGKGMNGDIDGQQVQQYWAAVVHTANEVSRFNRAQDESSGK